MRDWFRLTVRPSAVTHALHRAARQATPTYAALREQVRGSPVVSPDETSWKISGHLQWLWAYATPSTVVYAIQPGRGFPQAAAVLGADYAGVLVRNGWPPYRQFDHALHQTCLAHLLRRSRDMATDYPRAAWPRRVQAVLQQGLAVRGRRDRREISDHGVAVARGRLFKRLVALIHAPVATSRSSASPHICKRSCPASSAFSSTPRSMRPTGAPSKRFGPLSSIAQCRAATGLGAGRTRSRSSPVSSTRPVLRGLDTREILVDLLHAPQPIVSPVLASSKCE